MVGIKASIKYLPIISSNVIRKSMFFSQFGVISRARISLLLLLSLCEPRCISWFSSFSSSSVSTRYAGGVLSLAKKVTTNL